MRRLVTVLAMAGVAVAAAICASAAFFGVAVVTAVPALFLSAGLAVFAAVTYAGAVMVARRRAPERRVTTRRALFAVTATPLAALFVISAVVPPTPSARPPGLPGQSLVQLSTGSRLAVIKLPARAGPARPPVIMLHGGPGVPDLQANAEVLRPLTRHGYDVYLYAQLGTGESDRLADPRGYGRDRDVADLEALRQRLGLDHVVLIGHSYGGALAASYLARHTGHVAAMVLISPGPLDPADRSADRATARLSTGQQLAVYQALLRPRGLLGYGLLQVNPRAAHAYLPDAEADAINDTVVTRSGPGLHCTPARPAPTAAGTGFYAMQYPQSATAPAPSDPRPALHGLPVPTLIVKGSCDYLSWRSAAGYRHLLPQARLVYLAGAGHNAQQDKPATIRAAILAFLDHQPLPVATYTSDAVPPGYQGPR